MKTNLIIDIHKTEPSGSDEYTEPVSVSEVKALARIDVSDDDDDLLQSFITVARQQCEDFLNISLIQRSITLTAKIEQGDYWLPYGPVLDSGFSIKDKNGNVLTDYTLRGSEFKQICGAWCEPVTIYYNAGYDSLPAKFKDSIKRQAIYLNDNRGSDVDLSPVVKSILNAYRRVV